MRLLRLIVALALFVALASAALVLLAVTLSPGLMMRVIAPRWGRWMCAVAGIELVVEGREHLEKPAVIVANHQSALEVFIFPAVLPPKVRYVGKKEVEKIPFFGWLFRATGQIGVDRSDTNAAIAAINASLATLPKGLSVFLCPEGTRSADGTLGAFKKGAFHIAMQLGVPMVPFTLDGAQHLLPKHAWLPQPGVVRVKISPPVDTSNWNPETLDAHVAEVRGVIAGELDRMRAKAA